MSLSERLQKAEPAPPKPEKDRRPEWLRRKEDGWTWRGEKVVGLPAKELAR